MNTPYVGFQSVCIYGGRVYYTIAHTHKKQVGIFSCAIDSPQDIKDEMSNTDYSVGTRINVYGGECMCVCPHGIVFADTNSNMLVLVKDTVYTPLIGDGSYYYADVVYNAYDDTITYVCEHIATHAQHMERYSFHAKTTKIIATGADFYHCPTVWQDRTMWLQWDKQYMPWDNSTIVQDGTTISTGCGHFQPHFGSNGDVYYVKDTGQYHHIFCNGHNITAHIQMDFYMPLWIYGMRTYTVLDGTVVAIGSKHGEWQMGTIDNGKFTPMRWEGTPPSEILSLHSEGTGDNTGDNTGDKMGDNIGFVAKYPHAPDTIQVVQCNTQTVQNIHTIHTSDALPLSADYISVPKPVTFVNADGDVVHAFYYAPKNPYIKQDTLPPMLVKSHGGPTGQTTTSYNNKVQFWTSRGFAVLDVNYSGSTGYGSLYRNRLNRRWGELDVADVAYGVQYCIDNGLCNPAQVCISGSSAGGYAVLCALLAYSDIFKAGCSIYGIGDLHSLVAETHKFESKYLESLIAPYATHKYVYDARSPIQHMDTLKTPVLILQGTEDVVVSQNQAEQIYSVLRTQNIDTALILYEGEAHGFKNPKVKAHALQAELQFYQYIFNGTLPEYAINAVTTMQFE